MLIATIADAAQCTVELAAFPADDASMFLQRVAVADDGAIGFVVASEPGITFVDHPERPTGPRTVGVLRAGALTFTDLTGFANDLVVNTRAVVVGLKNDRPWLQTDDGLDLTTPGTGTFEWTIAEALPDGDVLVAGSGTGVVDGADCTTASDGELRTVVARLAGDTLQPRWGRGLCSAPTGSVGIDALVPEPARGLVHLLGSSDATIAFADTDVAVSPRDGDDVTGYLLSLDLDDGVPQAGRPAPFGRFVSARMLSDGRLAVALVAVARADFDGVEVAKGAIVITRP
jgi:uncharacterized protein YaiE (UPF0345 family)